VRPCTTVEAEKVEPPPSATLVPLPAAVEPRVSIPDALRQFRPNDSSHRTLGRPRKELRLAVRRSEGSHRTGVPAAPPRAVKPLSTIRSR
jgi:hypothetical protein